MRLCEHAGVPKNPHISTPINRLENREILHQSSRHPAAVRHTCLAVAATLMWLSGCTSVDMDTTLARTNQDAASFTQGRLALAQTAAQRAEREREATQRLAHPLQQQDAVQLALLNSPALQAMLAQRWADAAQAAQAGRPGNPVLSFERLRLTDELELGRLLSIGLLDLLTWPQRDSVARQRIEQIQLQLSLDVIAQVTQVRQAWVRAVAAQQQQRYAQQVQEVAQAGAELAQRMQAVGNFSALQAARQQAFDADATVQLQAAQQAVRAARENLVRALGLTDAQAAQLVLPERLPDLPAQPRLPEDVGHTASQQRLDIQLAQAALSAAAKAQGLTYLTSVTDIELSGRHDTVFDKATGSRANRNGYELNVRLPVFDWGDAQRDAMNAQTLAAANQLEAVVRAAGSHVRESYAGYRHAYDIARQYRDEVVPLRQRIAEANQLRYNGMLIGVFELLADSREQIGSVMAAITAMQQFWLADAALQASVMGQPVQATVSPMRSTVMGAGDAAGH